MEPPSGKGLEHSSTQSFPGVSHGLSPPKVTALLSSLTFGNNSACPWSGRGQSLTVRAVCLLPHSGVTSEVSREGRSLPVLPAAGFRAGPPEHTMGFSVLLVRDVRPVCGSLPEAGVLDPGLRGLSSFRRFFQALPRWASGLTLEFQPR